jgi:two-component system, NarL family, invasion response regulator UvrY
MVVTRWALLASHSVDTVILDLSLPGRSGLDTLPKIKREYPAVAVVVLSMHAQDIFGLRAIRAGAWAYVSKAD